MEKQIRWTIPTGSGNFGRARLKRWKSASYKALKNKKLFNSWIRETLDREAQRLLGPHKEK